MTGPADPGRLPARPRAPGLHSVRARVAVACAGLFLVVGGVLIAATYGIVGHISNPGLAKIKLATLPSYQKLQRACQGAKANGTILQDPAVARQCRRDRFDLHTLAGQAALRQRSSDRREFLEYSLAGLGVTTLLAGALGWAVAGQVLRPLRAITEAARAASQENLDQRLALTGPPDELKELADTFDGMLARLDAAFASQRRFVANASHELRTPLTEMRTLIDVTMAKPARSVRQLESVVAGVRAAVDKSEELIEALLTLARSDRGVGATEVVDLPTAVEDAADLLGPAAAAAQVKIETALGDARAAGDRVLLERLVTNLLDNAIRYNVPGGWVQATTGRQADGVHLTVANSGQPIPADQVPGLFEPFRRLGPRTGTGTGSGLGLSIVQSVVTAHGGQLTAQARPDGGLKIEITLPAAGPPARTSRIPASPRAQPAPAP
jgi:signal transduction histidine kinase